MTNMQATSIDKARAMAYNQNYSSFTSNVADILPPLVQRAEPMPSLDLQPSYRQHYYIESGSAIEMYFPYGQGQRQADVVYFDRPGEVHVNMALGALCSIGCSECSATQIRRGMQHPVNVSFSPEHLYTKAVAVAKQLRPLIGGRRLVISTMNDDDPFRRTVDGIAAVVDAIMEGCAQGGILLDRINLSSSLLATRYQSLIALADRYAELFGHRVVQIQASLLANNVKRDIFCGQGELLLRIVMALEHYLRVMRAATGQGSVWINYVAVRRGDFGRADGPERLDGIARIADVLTQFAPQITLKITRGTVPNLPEFEQLPDDEYAEFVEQVHAHWGHALNIYCPDAHLTTPENCRCGRIQNLLTF